MQSQSLIQTNHGVSFPLVGSKRVEQSDLLADDEEPSAMTKKSQSVTALDDRGYQRTAIGLTS